MKTFIVTFRVKDEVDIHIIEIVAYNFADAEQKLYENFHENEEEGYLQIIKIELRN